MVRFGGQELLFKVAVSARLQSSKYADGGIDVYRYYALVAMVEESVIENSLETKCYLYLGKRHASGRL